MINSEIVLSLHEQKICEYIAKKRYEINRQNNVENKKIGDQDDDFTDTNGFGGEFAFCKLFNVMPDFIVKVTQSNKNDYDAIIYNSIKVDVKTTKYYSGKLLVAKWKVDEVDVYALMVGEMPKYIFKGFILREELIKDTRLEQMKNGLSYVARQYELKEIQELLYVN